MLRYNHHFSALGGPCRFRVDHEDRALAARALDAAEAEVRRLEQKYSRYRPDSVISRINNAAGDCAGIIIDEETAGLLHYADTLWQQSEGRFDITSGPLRQAWNFKAGTLPRQQQITPLLRLIDWSAVHWNRERVRLPLVGMELDFGGIGKEYACDRAAHILTEAGVQHALVDLAGDLRAVGTQGDGEAWTIGIRHPDHEGRAVAHFALADQGLATSGDYERCVVIDGQRYGHLLDPTTGWPVSGLSSVSVVAQQCLVAGSSASLAMLMPADEALEWLATLGLPWLAVDREGGCHGSFSRPAPEEPPPQP